MPKRSFLEVDDSLIGKNLLFTEPDPSGLNTPFIVPGEEYPSRLVQPSAGFCCKTKEVGSETKVFVNVCTTDGIPSPKDISESELIALLDSDEITDFRVPMSIGEVKTDKDKKGDDVKVIDVAINPKFYSKVENSQIFKGFLLSVIFEGIANKNGIYTVDERIVLKNKKCFGNLQTHRIQQREVREKMGESGKNLISGISSEDKPKVGIQVLEGENVYITPEFRLYKRIEDDRTLFAEVKLPKVASTKELTLDINDDRFIIEAKQKRYLLDVFLPVFIQENNVICVFNTDTKILTIKMSIRT